MKKVATREKFCYRVLEKKDFKKKKFMLDVAEKFFWPCEEGKGWESCKEYCHANATFKTDSDTLIHLDRLEDYVEWMKDAHSMIANAKFEIKSIAEDTKRGMVLLYAIIYADNMLGEEPQPIETDYVYAMTIEDNKIKHITKIWYLNI